MGMFDSLGGMFGGDNSGGLYGISLDPQTRQAIAARGLLSAAGAFGQAAMPSRMPIPIGAALGSAAAAMGEGQDAALMNALRGQLLGFQGQKLGLESKSLQSQLTLRDKLMGALFPGGSPAQTSQPQQGQPQAQPAVAGQAAEPEGAPEEGSQEASRQPNASDPLDLIEHYESGGKNTPNYRFDPGHTAQGYYQITNTTWRGYAPKAGVDLQEYPNAMTAPKEIQRRVAATIYNTEGFSPWANYNPRLAAAIQNFQGGSAQAFQTGPVTGLDAARQQLAALPGPGAERIRLAQNGPPNGPSDMAAGLAAPGLSPQHLAVSQAYGKALDDGFKGTIQDFVSQSSAGGPSPAAISQRAVPPPTQPQTLAPQAAPQQMAPTTPPLRIGNIDLSNPQNVISLGALGDMAGIPSLATLIQNSPTYKAAVEAATAGAQNQSKLDFAPKLAPYEDPAFRARLAAQLFPPGTPERQMAEAHAANASGIKPFLGGERPGVPAMRYNPATGNYDIAFQNPRLGEGQLWNGQNVTVAPGAPQAETTIATAKAAGPATFQPFQYFGPGGSEQTLPRSMLPGIAASLAAGNNPFSAARAAGQPPSAAAVPPGNQRLEAAPPTYPVATPSGPKDLSSLTIDDLFPSGQGVPNIPPGKPGVTMHEINKDDATRLEGYGKEAAENPKVYQDLAHLADALKSGITTGKLAPMLTDMTNIGHQLGWEPEGGFQSLDPTNAAVMDKAATDLIFQAVKKLGGQVKVAEIEGYQRANPARAIPLEANYNILNDLLASGKWQDARAKLGNEFVVAYPGVPLNVFDTKFNQAVPLVDLAAAYKREAQKAGWKFPQQAGERGLIPEGGVVIGPNGHKLQNVGGRWMDMQTQQPYQPAR